MTSERIIDKPFEPQINRLYINDSLSESLNQSLPSAKHGFIHQPQIIKNSGPLDAPVSFVSGKNRRPVVNNPVSLNKSGKVLDEPISFSKPIKRNQAQNFERENKGFKNITMDVERFKE